MCNIILQQKIILRCRKQLCMLKALAQGLYVPLWQTINEHTQVLFLYIFIISYLDSD